MSEISETKDKFSSERRRKRMQNIKTGGDMMMYIGSASLVMPMVHKAREEQNSVMGACALGAGIILSIGLGGIASKIFNRTVDKAVDFWDEVKPSGPAKKPEAGEEKKDG